MVEKNVVVVSIALFSILNAMKCACERVTTNKQPVANEVSLNQNRFSTILKKDTLLGKNDGKEGLIHDVEKRASMMGFNGVRGKKDAEEDFFYYRMPQRYTSSNSYQPLYLNNWEKRAIVGFNGMRGKKNAWTADKKAAMGFNGMRGKKSGSGDDEDLLLNEESYRDDEYSKRATMGFHGMRGKKADEDSEWGKRAYAGFHGMRGKKNEDAVGLEGKLDDWQWEQGAKRTPQVGFFGVRGKKLEDNELDLNSLLSYLEESGPRLNQGDNGPLDRARRAASWRRNSKKARTAAFYGVRGKKAWAHDWP